MTSPQPEYYLERMDGSLTALIEVDQLPASIKILNIPKNLTLAQTKKLKWLGLRPRGPVYSVAVLDNHSSHPEQRLHPSDPIKEDNHFEREGKEIRGSVSNKEAHSSQLGRSDQSFTSLEIDSLLNNQNVRSSAPTSVANSIRTPPVHPFSASGPQKQLKKIYCTYWLRNGTCHFLQDGCKFKHEMPDNATLHEIGFRETPRWYIMTSCAKGVTSSVQSTNITNHSNDRKLQAQNPQTPSSISPRGFTSQKSDMGKPFSRSRNSIGSGKFGRVQKSSDSTPRYVSSSMSKGEEGIKVRGKIFQKSESNDSFKSRNTLSAARLQAIYNFQKLHPSDANTTYCCSVDSFPTTRQIKSSLTRSSTLQGETKTPRLNALGHLVESSETTYVIHGANAPVKEEGNKNIRRQVKGKNMVKGSSGLILRVDAEGDA